MQCNYKIEDRKKKVLELRIMIDLLLNFHECISGIILRSKFLKVATSKGHKVMKVI